MSEATTLTKDEMIAKIKASKLTPDDLIAKLQDRRLSVVAKKIGVHYTTLYELVNRKVNTSDETLDKLREYFEAN